MTDHTTPITDTHHPHDDRDRLLSRVIDGETRQGDFDHLASLAATDPNVWTELADLRAQTTLLEAALDDAAAVANRVGLDRAGLHTARDIADAPLDDLDHGPYRFDRREARPGRAPTAWLGWAAAAVLGLALIGPWRMNPDGSPASAPTGTQQASILPDLSSVANWNVPGVDPATPVAPASLTPEQAFAIYLATGRDRGRVLGEMGNRSVVEAHPTRDGRVEVVYVRRVVERDTIDAPYRIVEHEDGTRLLVPDPTRSAGPPM